MKRTFAAAVAAVAFAAAAPAYATDFFPGAFVPPPNGATFIVGGPGSVSPFLGPVSATYSRTDLDATASSTDRFIFAVGEAGLGSGDITTTFAGTFSGSTLNTDLLSVVFNNGFQDFVVNIGPGATDPNQETGSLSNIPLFANVFNTLTVTYLSRGDGQYSGTLSFTPNSPVPEPATWAMMLAGFGFIGFAMRRKQQAHPKVRFAF